MQRSLHRHHRMSFFSRLTSKITGYMFSLVDHLAMFSRLTFRCVTVTCFPLDGTMRVPQDVLQKAHQDLHSLRMSVFKLLQPKLQCNLGKLRLPQMCHMKTNSEMTLGNLIACLLTQPQGTLWHYELIQQQWRL